MKRSFHRLLSAAVMAALASTPLPAPWASRKNSPSPRRTVPSNSSSPAPRLLLLLHSPIRKHRATSPKPSKWRPNGSPAIPTTSRTPHQPLETARPSSPTHQQPEVPRLPRPPPQPHLQPRTPKPSTSSAPCPPPSMPASSAAPPSPSVPGLTPPPCKASRNTALDWLDAPPSPISASTNSHPLEAQTSRLSNSLTAIWTRTTAAKTSPSTFHANSSSPSSTSSGQSPLHLMTPIRHAYLTRLRPAQGLDWQHPQGRGAIWPPLGLRLPPGPATNRSKAHILYQRLVFDARKIVWDKDRSCLHPASQDTGYMRREYLSQIAPVPHAPLLTPPPTWTRISPPSPSSRPSARMTPCRSYLLHFFVEAQ